MQVQFTYIYFLLNLLLIKGNSSFDDIGVHGHVVDKNLNLGASGIDLVSYGFKCEYFTDDNYSVKYVKEDTSGEDLKDQSIILNFDLSSKESAYYHIAVSKNLSVVNTNKNTVVGILFEKNEKKSPFVIQIISIKVYSCENDHFYNKAKETFKVRCISPYVQCNDKVTSTIKAIWPVKDFNVEVSFILDEAMKNLEIQKIKSNLAKKFNRVVYKERKTDLTHIMNFARYIKADNFRLNVMMKNECLPKQKTHVNQWCHTMKDIGNLCRDPMEQNFCKPNIVKNVRNNKPLSEVQEYFLFFSNIIKALFLNQVFEIAEVERDNQTTCLDIGFMIKNVNENDCYATKNDNLHVGIFENFLKSGCDPEIIHLLAQIFVPKAKYTSMIYEIGHLNKFDECMCNTNYHILNLFDSQSNLIQVVNDACRCLRINERIVCGFKENIAQIYGFDYRMSNCDNNVCGYVDFVDNSCSLSEKRRDCDSDSSNTKSKKELDKKKTNKPKGKTMGTGLKILIGIGIASTAAISGAAIYIFFF